MTDTPQADEPQPIRTRLIAEEPRVLGELLTYDGRQPVVDWAIEPEPRKPRKQAKSRADGPARSTRKGDAQAAVVRKLPVQQKDMVAMLRQWRGQIDMMLDLLEGRRPMPKAATNGKHSGKARIIREFLQTNQPCSIAEIEGELARRAMPHNRNNVKVYLYRAGFQHISTNMGTLWALPAYQPPPPRVDPMVEGEPIIWPKS